MFCGTSPRMSITDVLPVYLGVPLAAPKVTVKLSIVETTTTERQRRASVPAGYRGSRLQYCAVRALKFKGDIYNLRRMRARHIRNRESRGEVYARSFDRGREPQD